MCPFGAGIKQFDVDENQNKNLKATDNPDKVATKGGGTSLGNLGVTTSTKENMVMTFTGGQKCYNGPKRNAKVTLVCGETNKLMDVDESTICSYVFKMETPAMCGEYYKAEKQITEDEIQEVEKVVAKESKRWFF